MKKLVIGMVSILLLAATFGQAADEAEQEQAPALNDKEKLSYSFGFEVGSQFEQMGTDVNLDEFMAGVRDGLQGSDSKVSKEEMNRVRQDYFRQLRDEQKQVQDAAAKENIEKGRAFLEENAKKEGVKVTDSGLQYKVLKESEGPKPKATDRVTVHYKGTLIDGTQFDSSYDRGQPTTFKLDGVIKGWTEGLQLMSVGSKYRFFIPGELAYGERGAGQQIGPYEVLIFDVELLSIE
jgi:FKBP-type peptidyl-prolyl cis-trans isomerase